MRLFRLALAGLFFLIATSAAAQECVRPGQPFECVGAECEMFAGATSGQQAEILTDQRRVRIRAVSTSTVVESSYGELYGVVIEPEAPLFLRGHVSVTYDGSLTGFGGGNQNFGRIDIKAVIRNLDTDELVASDRVVEGENSGGPFSGGPSAFQNFFPGPPDTRDVPFQSAEGIRLEAGVSYGIGIGVRAEADGNEVNTGVSNFFTGNRGVFLNAVKAITWPDNDEPGWQDSDGDGLADVWEDEGITDCDGVMLLNLPQFGADPEHKDLFVEIDWTQGREPNRREMQTLKESFSFAPVGAGGVDNPDGDRGINLWLDTGGLVNSAGDLVGDDLGGGSEIPAGDIPDPGGEFIPPLWEVGDLLPYSADLDGNGLTDFYEVKQKHFDLIRTGIFRYVIMAPARSEEDHTYPGGQAETGGDDLVIFMPGPGLLMHELGHNLSLSHGGNEELNCKPNYVSVMNYFLVSGIPRRSRDAMAQDIDNDGTDDPFILDYSPPRLTATTRGKAPLFDEDDPLVENDLSEFRELDESDDRNSTRFFNPDGDGRDLRLDEAPDWDGGGNTGGGTSVNVNFADDFFGCDEDDNQALSSLSGFDDWTAITLPVMVDGIVEEVVQNQSGATPEPELPHPTPEQIRGIEARFATLDLAVEKTAVPELVMAGQVVTYKISVTNNGPNDALHVIVKDNLPEFVTPVDLPDLCEETETGVVECKMDVIAEGETAILNLQGRVAPRLPCTNVDTVELVNAVEVRNGDFADTAPGNNSASAQSEALCLRYEYGAKFVCGVRDDQDSLLALPGTYGTVVNIHNPQSRRQPFFKKLALTFPPPKQAAGKVHPIGIDELGYDEALKADCDDIRTRLFDGEFPGGFIEGYLIVQSPRTLDVDAFYSAGSPQAGVRSIDLEEIKVRDLRTALSVTKTSQTFRVPLGSGPDALRQFRLAATLYTVTIENGGEIHAEAVKVQDEVKLNLAGLLAGAMIVLEEPFELPVGATRTPIESAAPFHSASFQVNLPELAPDSSVEFRFWALSLIYQSDPGDPLNAAVLVNRADVSSQGPDTTLVDNSVTTEDNLLE